MEDTIVPPNAFQYNYNSTDTTSGYWKGRHMNITGACAGNQITKEYYWHLVKQINDGTVLKAVCRRENKRFGLVSYHLINYGY